MLSSVYKLLLRLRFLAKSFRNLDSTKVAVFRSKLKNRKCLDLDHRIMKFYMHAQIARSELIQTLLRVFHGL